MKVYNGDPIIAGGTQTYDSTTTSFIYYSDFYTEKVNIKFQPVRGGLYGKYCWISFEVKNCYLGCKTCKALGIEVDHQKCSSCADSKNYYQRGDKLSDNTLNCIREDLSIGYYKDSFGIYRQCNSTCKTCENSGTTTNATCITCKDGYLKLEVPSREDDSSNCYQSSDPSVKCPEGYFYTYQIDPLDSSKKINEKCGKCYEKCSTCESYGDENTMKCIKCIDNHYFKLDKIGNCYTGAQNSYFLKDDDTDINGKIYIPCDPSCKSCYGVKITTTPTSTNCIECDYDNNYFPVYDTDNTKPKNCLQPLRDTVDASPIENYYLNKPNPSEKTTYTWKRCYTTCKYCTREAEGDNHNCISFNCITGTYPSVDKRTNCYTDDIKNDGYYLGKTPSISDDPSETHPLKDIYLKCYSTCKKCYRGGDNNLNNCDECIDGYYPKENVVGSCALNPPTYYLDDDVYKKCYYTCQTCDSLGDDTNHKCLSCIEGSNTDPDGSYKNCIQDCGSGKYFPKDSPTETSCRVCNTPKEYIEGIYCINCKNYGKYHIDGESQCIEASDVDSPTGNKINYYKENDNYGTIKACDTSCKTCSNGPGTKTNDDGTVINTKNCLSCDNTYYLLDGNCIDDCEEW